MENTSVDLSRPSYYVEPDSRIYRFKRKLTLKPVLDIITKTVGHRKDFSLLEIGTGSGFLLTFLESEFPKANFVKAFNSIGSAFMVNPDFKGQKPTMFICGNDEEAKKEVSQILDLFGFEVEDMGKVEAARAIEPLCMLWCIPGFLKNEWTHAFKLLKK